MNRIGNGREVVMEWWGKGGRVRYRRKIKEGRKERK